MTDSSPQLSRKKLKIAAFATALLWWLAMQSDGAFAFGWIAFTPLLLVAGEIPDLRGRFFYGWRAGFLCFAWHNWWLLPTITKAGAMIGATPPVGAALGVLAVGIIALGHGLGIAFLAAVWNPRAPIFERGPLALPICAGLLWWLFDWVRSSGELAHSWGALAFSQWRDAALLQSVSVLGQHGLSALCLWFGASLALWLRKEYSARAPSLWRVPVAVFALLHLWGAWRIWTYDRAAHEKFPVLLVQTNVGSLRKNIGGGESHFAQAERLTREYFANRNFRSPALIVWPETTTALYQNPDSDFASRSGERGEQMRRLDHLLREFKTPILLGAQVFELASSGRAFILSNRAVLLASGDREEIRQQSSAKTRVVPFGERAAFVEILPFLQKLAPDPPVTPAPAARVLSLQADGPPIGTVICFESCFSEPALELKKQGARILFVLSNDEWFSGTTAPWERAAMSVLRAAESGLPVAQCTNGGYSLLIDARGRILKSIRAGTDETLQGDIPLALRATP